MFQYSGPLTEEEKALMRKYADLKKKKMELQLLEKQRSSKQTSQHKLERISSNKPTVDPRKATEQARTLALSGSLSFLRKENKKSGFKAPLHREPKSKKSKSVGSGDHNRDQGDAGAASSSHDVEDREEEPEVDMEQDTDQDGPNRDGGQEEERGGDGDGDRDTEHDGDTPFRSSGLYLCCQGKQKGNTVYVGGSVLDEDSLRSAFSQHGNVLQVRMDNVRSGAFITFDKIESADQAVAKLHGSTLGSVSITAGIARRQPMLDAATDKSMWLTSSSTDEQTSSTGSHMDTSD